MKLELVSFMSHDSTVVDLPDRGVVLVTGPNGSGKSALVESVATALWGKGLRGSRWSPWHAGQPGRVRLQHGALTVERSWDGKSKSLRWSSTDAFDTTMKAQAGLDAAVGSFEVWRRTCVFSSSDAAHFTLASDVERKTLLEQLLGLAWFDAAHKLCLADLKHAYSASGSAKRESELAATRAQALAEGLKRLEEQRAAEAPAGDVGTLRLDRTKYQQHERDVGQESAALLTTINELTFKLGELRARDRIAGERLERVTSNEVCPTCEQPISRVLVDRLARELKQAGEARVEAEQLTKIESERLQAEVRELEQEARGLRDLAAGVSMRIQAIESARTRVETLDRNLKATGQEIAKSASKLAELLDREKKLSVDVAELEACERVLNARGVRSQVVGGTLAAISARANAWLSRLGSDLSLELKPYTERKSGAVADAISLTLEGAGGEAGYPGASAGERRRVDVSLLLSLAELAGAASAETPWRSPVFFDEVFDSLDGDGREAVGELVRDVARDRCVVVVTHDESLADIRADLHLHVDSGVVT